MLIHLVLKDFLIVKKYVLLVLLVAVAVPPFLLWRNPEPPCWDKFSLLPSAC